MSVITLLDGGMGQELIRRSGDKPTPLWATQVMLDHPGLVEAIHSDYFAAGSSLATTNSYALHHDRFVGTGLEEQFDALLESALHEAHRARDAHGRGLIAAAIGPLAASYRPELQPPHDAAVPLYSEIVGKLAPKADLILFETVASLAHAEAVLAAGKSTEKPVWLAVTVDDEDGRKLRSGEPVADLAKAAKAADALLANCSAPEAMEAALLALKPSGKPFGAYANGFTQITKDFLKDKPTVDALESRDLSPQAYASFAKSWLDLGATIIGGCCETGPAHIAALADMIHEMGHEIA